MFEKIIIEAESSSYGNLPIVYDAMSISYYFKHLSKFKLRCFHLVHVPINV